MQKSFKQHFWRRLGFRDPVFVAGLFALYTCVFTAPAFAYLDPGTGSFLFQLLIGALVGGIFVVKSYWIRLKNWFTGSTSADADGSVGSVGSVVNDKEKAGGAAVSDKASAKRHPQEPE